MNTIYSFSPFGYEGAMVSVEVDLRRGIPAVDVVGLADNAVKESRERMRAAIRNSGFDFPGERVLISLSPADVKKEGAGFDLPIALAVLAAKHMQDTSAPEKKEAREKSGSLELSLDMPSSRSAVSLSKCDEKLLANADGVLVMGELELSGRVRPVRAIQAAVSTAAENGIRYCLIPEENKLEAENDTVQIFAVSTLKEAFDCLRTGFTQADNGKKKKLGRRNNVCGVSFPPLQLDLDYTTVKNQGKLIRGLQVAAAGTHSLMVYGPPGCGKTLAIERFPTILPCLTAEESRSVTRIYSLAGLIPAGGRPYTERPFRSPHQSASLEGLIGGGMQCRPGEISLAHNGVLFLDEAAEFRTSVLQSLRIPLETGCVTLSRAGRHTVYPAHFQLLVASNPCPCGNFGTPDKVCVCSPRAVEQYWKKFSAPLLDRIDIRIPLMQKDVQRLNGSETNFSKYDDISSNVLRRDIARAVEIQRKRQGKPNAWLTPEECAASILLPKNFGFDIKNTDSSLSGRAINSIAKLARTIADMEGSDAIQAVHVREAVILRKNEDGFDICF